ncbi:putative Anti-sigma regulatory factor [Streptomyces misionensis JCM 4497]
MILPCDTGPVRDAERRAVAVRRHRGTPDRDGFYHVLARKVSGSAKNATSPARMPRVAATRDGPGPAPEHVHAVPLARPARSTATDRPNKRRFSAYSARSPSQRAGAAPPGRGARPNRR